MKSSTAYIIGIILTIGIGAILQYFLCCGGGSMAEEVHTSVPVRGAGMPFALEDPSGGFSVHSNDNFNFPLSTYSFLTPLSSDVENGIGELMSFLNDNKDVSLSITGYAYPEEDNLSAFPTLGEARANAVKSALIERGLPGEQLSVHGASMDGSWSGQDSIIRGPVSYMLSRSGGMADGAGDGSDTGVANSGNEGGGDDVDFSEFVQNLKSNPLVLHFETGSAYVNLTADERQTISTLNQYIDQNNQAQIVIQGHTDNSGSVEVNERLGMERAEFLKSYLVRNGFRPERIETISHGQSQPVASNDTEEGKAENRRAILTIQN